MKKIAFITAFTPNRNSAGQNITLALIRRLSNKFNIDVYIIDYREEEITETFSDNVRIFRMKISKFERILNIILLFFINPLFTNRFNIVKALKLRKIIQSNNYDAVIFNFSQVFLYSVFISAKNKVHIAHDVIYQLFTRKKYPIIKKVISRFTFWSERIILNLIKKEFVVLNRKDYKLYRKLYKIESSIGNVLIDENALNINYNDIELENSIVLFASWKRKENKEMFFYFFDKIYPLLDKSIKIYVLGSGISEEMEKYLLRRENVIKVGFIDNPYTYIAKSKILFAVLFQGAGIKIKVLESLACGTYVIGNKITFEGIDFCKGKISIKDNEDCVNKIEESINKISLQEKKQLRDSFLEYYKTTPKIDSLIEFLIL